MSVIYVTFRTQEQIDYCRSVWRNYPQWCVGYTQTFDSEWFTGGRSHPSPRWDRARFLALFPGWSEYPIRADDIYASDLYYQPPRRTSVKRLWTVVPKRLPA